MLIVTKKTGLRRLTAPTQIFKTSPRSSRQLMKRAISNVWLVIPSVWLTKLTVVVLQSKRSESFTITHSCLKWSLSMTRTLSTSHSHSLTATPRSFPKCLRKRKSSSRPRLAWSRLYQEKSLDRIRSHPVISWLIGALLSRTLALTKHRLLGPTLWCRKTTTRILTRKTKMAA